MADPNIKCRSDGESRRRTGLERGNSAALAAREMNSRWSYDIYNNPSTTVAIKRAQYALCTWKEELKDSRELEDSKKADLSELWTGVYQIVGFYSVFQGVIYQGVTAMSSILSCGFYKIPVLLSVLASAATILGISMKLSAVRKLSASLNEDSTHIKELRLKIDAGYKCDVKDFSVEKIEDQMEKKDQTMYEMVHREALYKASLLQWAVLVFLAAFSALFSYLDYIVMCRGYS